MDGGGRRVICEVEAELAVVARIKRLRRRGCTFERIARTLNDEHTPTKRGGRWHATTVRNLAVRREIVPSGGGA